MAKLRKTIGSIPRTLTAGDEASPGGDRMGIAMDATKQRTQASEGFPERRLDVAVLEEY